VALYNLTENINLYSWVQTCQPILYG